MMAFCDEHGGCSHGEGGGRREQIPWGTEEAARLANVDVDGSQLTVGRTNTGPRAGPVRRIATSRPGMHCRMWEGHFRGARGACASARKCSGGRREATCAIGEHDEGDGKGQRSCRRRGANMWLRHVAERADLRGQPQTAALDSCMAEGTMVGVDGVEGVESKCGGVEGLFVVELDGGANRTSGTGVADCGSAGPGRATPSGKAQSRVRRLGVLPSPPESARGVRRRRTQSPYDASPPSDLTWLSFPLPSRGPARTSRGFRLAIDRFPALWRRQNRGDGSTPRERRRGPHLGSPAADLSSGALLHRRAASPPTLPSPGRFLAAR
ncbi:hypothetical protein OH77DRAFT_208672 [Trametes cingulata]|nr:hypothetical protein OH77DRAFT_208672 [Trametes cingulata]